MDSAHEDCFAVFLRDEHDRNPSPETAEYPLALCASYEEALTGTPRASAARR